MQILNCIMSDLDAVIHLHDAARQLQAEKNMVVWPVFEQTLLEKDIAEKRAWKLILNGQMVCTWSITLNDKEIWGEMDKDNSIFLHRIATHPDMRGNHFINDIVRWAKEYVVSLGREYVRLDTLGYNPGLIQHYTSAGFTYLGITKVTDVKNLPAHYHRELNCLRFEVKIEG